MNNNETFDRAVDKVRDEMAKAKGGQIQLLGEGLTALLQLHPEWAEPILAEGKTLVGALGEVRKNATGGCSDPIQTTKSLCAYYGVKCENPHVLALEVTVALMGDCEKGTGMANAAPAKQPQTSADPDPFDLDALLA